MVEIKYDFVMAENIKGGLTLNDFKKLEHKINSAFNNLNKKCENNELGFMKCIYDDLSIYEEIKDYSKDFENVVIIGMGGSVLGAQAVYEGVKGIYYNEFNNKDNKNNNKKVYFLDNSDPEKTYEILNIVNLEKTLIFAISKSGNTAETLSNFLIFERKLKETVTNYEKNIIIIANTGKLKEIAVNNNYKYISISENVGGRFSVLSPVGLAPLCCLGIDINKLIDGAKKVSELCKSNDIFKNPSLLNATIHYLAHNNGKTISVLMPYIERLHKFGLWYRQLWAESIGKKGVGQTPVVSIGAKDQHSQLQLYIDGPKDKIITFMEVKNYKYDLDINGFDYLSNKKLSELIKYEKIGTEKALKNNNIPNISINIETLDEYTLGMLIYFYEMTTAYIGELLEINAFDQPAVEEGKIITRNLLGKNKINYDEKDILNKYILKF